MSLPYSFPTSTPPSTPMPKVSQSEVSEGSSQDFSKSALSLIMGIVIVCFSLYGLLDMATLSSTHIWSIGDTFELFFSFAGLYVGYNQISSFLFD